MTNSAISETGSPVAAGFDALAVAVANQQLAMASYLKGSKGIPQQFTVGETTNNANLISSGSRGVNTDHPGGPTAP